MRKPKIHYAGCKCKIVNRSVTLDKGQVTCNDCIKYIEYYMTPKHHLTHRGKLVINDR
jgi:hypothetical protein